MFSGVLNVVNGGKDTVNGLLTHPDIKAISFVGSNSAGEYIHDVGSKNGKRVQANLGAKNHATILMDDADRASTVKAVVGAAFGAAGQRCMALSVVILVGDVNESQRWIEEVVEEAKKLKVGNGFQDGVDVGEYIICFLQYIHYATVSSQTTLFSLMYLSRASHQQGCHSKSRANNRK